MSARNTVIFQDSKSTFIISDFKNFSKNVFETAEFWCIIGLVVILRLLQRKTPFFFKMLFLLLVSERGLSPDSCLTICHARASCL